MTGFKPDWSERIQRGRIKAWSRGYNRGYLDGLKETESLVRESIIRNLLSDAVFITNVDVKIVDKIVRIVEES